jgi:hypothetical protein
MVNDFKLIAHMKNEPVDIIINIKVSLQYITNFKWDLMKNNAYFPEPKSYDSSALRQKICLGLAKGLRDPSNGDVVLAIHDGDSVRFLYGSREILAMINPYFAAGKFAEDKRSH